MSVKSSTSIRQEFFEFFESKAHTLVPSASLVPDNDQTLLFTNAGMNQFKDVFLGTGSRPYKRAVDTQKVMRVSGKHNDFDDVGRDTYHHTFFEMLGNWSFGDFYKEEAIIWAWELLTEKWNLPKERLYATVYYQDEESFEIWKTKTDIDHSHILKCGDKENFWEMGATGPCGPCSEIHIDLTPDLAKSIGVKGVNADDPLFIELWNLVFIQFNRKEDGTLEDLPNKHVDTGMGFERITAVLQNKLSNYDTDLFSPIIDFLAQKSGIAYKEGIEGTPHRVIADHIRALSFAIADGIIPANDGRGYVIRKILRRAIRFGRELGFVEPFLYNLVDIVVSIMSQTFPEISDRKESIKSVIQAEESSFFRTLNKGFDKIKDLINQAKTKNKTQISGEDVFLLYDSMGFPVDFTEQILKDEDLSYDVDQFNILMQEQKERARASWKGEGLNFSAFGNLAKTKFIGHEESSCSATILGIVKENTKITSATQNEEIAIVLDQTPFYGEKGGQVGDSGTLTYNDTLIEIFDTKIFEEKYIHFGKIISGSIKEGQQITASIDEERRHKIACNHSGAHLLFKALRDVLGDHIGQAGSWTGADRFRIDFTHPKGISAQELQKIEQIVNNDIQQNYQTTIEELPIDVAKSQGAVAAFEEKYGDVVRVVTIGASKELCGGSHIHSSGELGLMVLLGDSSVSSGTRRLEALTGKSAINYVQQLINKEKLLTETLKCSSSEIMSKIDKIIDDSKNKDKEIQKLNAQLAQGVFDELKTSATNNLIVGKVSVEMIDELSKIFRNTMNSGILVLGGVKENNEAVLSVSVTKDLTSKIKAGDLIKEIAPLIEGKGGGKPEQAMAGGKNGTLLAEALNKAQEIIKNLL